MKKPLTYSTILVTGATGFLGGRLVEYLSEATNYSIYATGRNSQKGYQLNRLPRVTFIPAELQFSQAVHSLCKHIDVVVHCAARSSLWGSYQSFLEANVVATQNIVNACQAQQVKRLIHISTPSIYYAQLGQGLYDKKEEEVPTTFISHYAQSKYQAEQIVKTAAQGGLAAIILRPRAIYGRGDYTIMPRILNAYEAGRLRVIGNGKNKHDMTHVRNVISAIMQSIDAPTAALGQAYNITDGQPYNVWDTVGQVLEALQLPWQAQKVPYAVVDKVAWGLEQWAKWTNSQAEPTLTRASVSITAHEGTLHIDKAKDLLHYNPSFTLEEGIEEFVSWWTTRQ